MSSKHRVVHFYMNNERDFERVRSGSDWKMGRKRECVCVCAIFYL